ncbi:MAG TPA: adenylyltransferase/cytidyltransferase family protein [Candidatus Saccharimonadales bacterium]|nr:adenylyltransferase/cytidyltransferase family protein [Candidatus Saccharimonadales bacterium]
MIKRRRKKLRIGVYAGAFDPVHAGHIAFALQALKAARLDQVVFVPERRPRAKPGVEHFGHRVAMLKTALAPHPNLAVLEMVERQFTVARTLPGLQAIFPGAELVFLMGSDAVLSLPAWRHADRMMGQCEFVIGLRSSLWRPELERSIRAWNPRLDNVSIVPSYAPDVSSSDIRQALRTNQEAKGLLSSVQRYARREWLYVAPAYQLA